MGLRRWTKNAKEIARRLFIAAIAFLAVMGAQIGSMLNCLLLIFISEWGDVGITKLPSFETLWIVGLCGGIIGFMVPQLLDSILKIVADYYPQKPELARRVDFVCAIWRKYSALALLILGIILVWFSPRDYSATVCLASSFLMWGIIGSLLDSVMVFLWRLLNYPSA